MAETKIEWTDRVWNPTRGCTKISPGCAHCYAETFAERWRGVKGHPYEQGFDLRLVPEKLGEPLKWKAPARVFVNSMSDLFHKDVPDEFIDCVFAVMALAPHLTFQLLTKRAERMRDYLSDVGRPKSIMYSYMARFKKPWTKNVLWPLPNVWLGVSVENQDAANARIPLLLATPAAVRWISAEPLLGPLLLESPKMSLRIPYCLIPDEDTPALDWVVCGGESGPGARPFDVAWARALLDQCRGADVPFFMKQLGANTKSPINEAVPLMLDKKGGNPAEWPEDLRVREFPKTARQAV